MMDFLATIYNIFLLVLFGALKMGNQLVPCSRGFLRGAEDLREEFLPKCHFNGMAAVTLCRKPIYVNFSLRKGN